MKGRVVAYQKVNTDEDVEDFPSASFQKKEKENAENGQNRNCYLFVSWFIKVGVVGANVFLWLATVPYFGVLLREQIAENLAAPFSVSEWLVMPFQTPEISAAGGVVTLCLLLFGHRTRLLSSKWMILIVVNFALFLVMQGYMLQLPLCVADRLVEATSSQISPNHRDIGRFAFHILTADTIVVSLLSQESEGATSSPLLARSSVDALMNISRSMASTDRFIAKKTIQLASDSLLLINGTSSFNLKTQSKRLLELMMDSNVEACLTEALMNVYEDDALLGSTATNAILIIIQSRRSSSVRSPNKEALHQMVKTVMQITEAESAETNGLLATVHDCLRILSQLYQINPDSFGSVVSAKQLGEVIAQSIRFAATREPKHDDLSRMTFTLMLDIGMSMRKDRESFLSFMSTVVPLDLLTVMLSMEEDDTAQRNCLLLILETFDKGKPLANFATKEIFDYASKMTFKLGATDNQVAEYGLFLMAGTVVSTLNTQKGFDESFFTSLNKVLQDKYPQAIPDESIDQNATLLVNGKSLSWKSIEAMQCLGSLVVGTLAKRCSGCNADEIIQAGLVEHIARVLRDFGRISSCIAANVQFTLGMFGDHPMLGSAMRETIKEQDILESLETSMKADALRAFKGELRPTPKPNGGIRIIKVPPPTRPPNEEDELDD